MKYHDRVYGKVEILTPVILEIINAPSLQRLKHIDQAGYRAGWVKPNADVAKQEHSRFAHSVGVYLLLKKFGASLEEQIAGLIHDVSHSVFSHCVDYALEAGSETEHNYQDRVFDEFVRKTEIPNILKKYGQDVEYILNEKNFPLKEKELPDLCADRIDYSLRTAVLFEKISKEKVNYFLDNLTVENNNWVFKKPEMAKEYAELFLKLNREYYAGISSAVMLRTVGDYLKYALEKEYIEEKDLYSTDETVLSKIGRNLNNDRKLQLLFDRMNKKIEVKQDSNNYDARVFVKSRIVDPLCKYQGNIRRISEIDEEWSNLLDKEAKPKEYFIKFAK